MTSGDQVVGDISAEPSMEEILSSIKRIIAEEGDSPVSRRRAAARPLPAPVPAVEDEPHEEVLELSDPMPPVFPPAAAEAAPRQPVSFAPVAATVTPPAPEPALADVDPILSNAAADATRGALQALSKLMVKPEPQSDGTLEGLVRDMLRPMLREWLDANLPEMVEAMVAKEIARISGQGR